MRGFLVRSGEIGKQSNENIGIKSVLPLLFANGKYKVKQRPVDIALHLMEEVKLEYNKIVRSWKFHALAIESPRYSQVSLEINNEHCPN